MPGYFYLPDFERIQHYKDRNPVWIKLYNALLTDPRFMLLEPTNKWVYVGMMLLSSQYANRIENNPEWISRLLGVENAINPLKRLLASKLLACEGIEELSPLKHADASMDTKQSHLEISPLKVANASAEKRRVEKRREESGCIPKVQEYTPTPDPAFAVFQTAHREHLHTEYESKRGDFVRLAALRKSNHLDTRGVPPSWDTAIANYFASPLRAWTLADLCVRYPVFVNSPVDRFGTPINHNGARYESAASQRQRQNDIAIAEGLRRARLAGPRTNHR